MEYRGVGVGDGTGSDTIIITFFQILFVTVEIGMNLTQLMEHSGIDRIICIVDDCDCTIPQ